MPLWCQRGKTAYSETNAKGSKSLLIYCDSHYKSTISSKSKARNITKRCYTTKRPSNHSIQSDQMKHTRLNQQTNDQNIPNNLSTTKYFNRSTKASQSITATVPINQGTNVTLATQPREASQPAKRLCSAKGIIWGCMQSCQVARNGGCRPNSLCCTLSHSQKDQWPGWVSQKTVCNSLTSIE